jgi:hypothetical protein
MPSTTVIKLTELTVFLGVWLAREGEIIKFSEQAQEGSFTDLELVTAKARTVSNIGRIKKQRALSKITTRDKVPGYMRSHSYKRSARVGIKHDVFGSCFLRAVRLKRNLGPPRIVRLFWFNFLGLCRLMNQFRGQRHHRGDPDIKDDTELCSACSRSFPSLLPTLAAICCNFLGTVCSRVRACVQSYPVLADANKTTWDWGRGKSRSLQKDARTTCTIFVTL